MGYTTRYKIAATQPVIDAIRERSEDAMHALDENGGTDESRNWYEHEESVAGVSADFPDEVLTLYGEGEEAGDIWRKYFKAGKVQESQAVLTFEEYDPEKLRKPAE